MAAFKCICENNHETIASVEIEYCLKCGVKIVKTEPTNDPVSEAAREGFYKGNRAAMQEGEG